MAAKKTEILIGPTPQALVSYNDPNRFKFYKLLDQTAPPETPTAGSVHYYAGVGSESFCLADDLYYRKWADGTWAVTDTA